MVSSTIDATGGQLVIKPNRSLTWRQTKLFYALVATTTLVVAIGFAVIGFWPILPFAGLELGVLWVGLWMCATSGQQIEVVSVTGGRIAVDKGTSRPQRVWESPAVWAQVRLRASRSWYPSTLVLRSHGSEVQLGSFLVEDERRELAGKLRQLLERGNPVAAGPGGSAATAAQQPN